MKGLSVIFSLGILIFISSCSDVRIKEKDEWGKFFKQNGVDGSFELYDNNKEIASYYNKEKSSDRAIPFSTFDIFNSLVALESSEAPDEQMLIQNEDGKNLTLKEAFTENDTPYFQELAKRIGKNTLQRYLDTVRYGNMEMGKTVDEFWLDGSLLISPDEQVGLMKRLYHGEIAGFSERSHRIVRSMMLREEGKNYRLYFKGYFGPKDGKTVNWLVGFIEQVIPTRNQETKLINNIPHPYFFALTIDQTDGTKDLSEVSLNILKEIMKSMNVELN